MMRTCNDVEIGKEAPHVEEKNTPDLSQGLRALVDRSSNKVYDLSIGGDDDGGRKDVTLVSSSHDGEKSTTKTSIASKVARFISRHPRIIILMTISVAIIVSLLAVFVSDFQLATENKKGWKSRGTIIAKRGMQHDLISNHREVLFNDMGGDEWKHLTTTVLDGYYDLKSQFLRSITLEPEDIQLQQSNNRRHLEEDETCDASWYSSPQVLLQDNLLVMWEAADGVSILNPGSIQTMCIAEEKTMEALRDNNLCGTCNKMGKDCLPPLSLIHAIRQYLSNVEGKHLSGVESMSCTELASAYTKIASSFTQDLVQCADELRGSFGKSIATNATVCPSGFTPQLLHKDFGVDGSTLLTHSTSSFHTAGSDTFELFSVREEFGYGSEDSITAVYDTNAELFNDYTIDEYILSDLVLAAISGFLAFVTIAIHTGSPWLVLLGSLQITLSIPLSYFVYYFIFGLRFFSLLNFIGFFVSAALGADNLFVASDKWKIFRLKYPEKSTEDIASMALPEAASAMLLTTSTTSVAFFATCLSPVAPIFCFAVFCGLMVVFNYILNCTLVFPGICLYDEWLANNSTSYFVSSRTCNCMQRKSADDLNTLEEDGAVLVEDKMTRKMRRLMDRYYMIVHAGRWPILLACLAGLGVSSYFAQTISLPENTEVRMLSDSHPLEELHKSFDDLLSSYLRKISIGAPVDFYFGVNEKDTGDYNNPDTLSSLELDETFDPSPTDAQQYLLDFCGRLFDEPFAYEPNSDYKCSINRLDDWLGKQALLPLTERASGYNSKCKGAASLPMPESDFHACFIYWSQLESDSDVLQWDGKVRILTVRSGTSKWIHTPLADVRKEWEEFEAFKEKEESSAPPGVNKWFHTSGLWWWNDTYRSMMQTGISSLYIAISFAFVVTFVSSRSVVCSAVSSLSIFFILVASTATLVGLGWELGFLEWICFAILVGISADFVIHFSHSYTRVHGTLNKEERTRYALVNMGPSILGATITTFAVAFMMLFCKVVFFIKFAQLLIVTISYSLLGSFVFYILIMDIFGPAAPTRTMDTFTSWVKREK